ncbi:MAG: carbohydrate binding domain-containing protein [Bacteroidota bacterium]
MNKINLRVIVVGFLFSIILVSTQILQATSDQEEVSNKGKIGFDYYVSKARGHNKNEGTKEKPFASIDGARDYLRTISEPMDSDKTVFIEEGIYELDEPLVFGSQDAGKNGYTITYKAVEGQEVWVSGGRKVKDWETMEGSSIIRTKVPEQVGTYLGQFYASGKLKPVATSGNTFNLLPNGGAAFRTEKRLMAPASIFEGVEDPSELFLDFFLMYIQLKIPIASVNIEGDEAEVIIPEDFPVHKMLPASSPWTPQVSEEKKFAVMNGRKFLDSPGEWYFDRTERYLYYYPEAEEKMETLEAFIPVHDRVIEFKGTNAEDRVKNITLEGISIAHSNYGNPIQYGYLSSHSDYIEYPDEIQQTIPAAIFIEYAENIGIKNCQLGQFGGSGIGIRRSTQSISIEKNRMYQIGAGAISVGYLLRGIENVNPDAVYLPEGGYWKDAIYHNENFEAYPDIAYIPTDIVVEDNILDEIGIDFGTNNGITVYHAKRAHINYNFIRNVGFCGISICTDHFWNPKYEEGNELVGDHQVRGNLVVDACRVLYDGALIYVLYRNSGENLITRNCIFIDKMGERGHNCAVYIDEGSTNYTLAENVVDVPDNMKKGWLVINQREAKMPRHIKVHDNYLANNDNLGKEWAYSTTLDGNIDNDTFNIYVHDNHYQGKDWSSEAKNIIKESGPRNLNNTPYADIIKAYKKKLLKEKKATPGYYESFKLTEADNNIPNGNFESSVIHPWIGSGALCQVQKTDAFEGKYCVEVKNRRFPWGGPKIRFDAKDIGDLKPGRYTLSFALKTMGDIEISPSVQITTKDGKKYGSRVTFPLTEPADTWVQYSKEIELTWEGEIQEVQFGFSTSESSPDKLAGYYLDEVKLSRIE